MKLGLGNGVRVITTKKSGGYAVITTDTNRKSVKRIAGRKEAIRQGQHKANDAKSTSRV